jgi:chromosome segregation ATPase
VQDKMRQAKNDLQNEKPFKASDKQKEAMADLDKVIAALEERRDEQVEKLMAKQRKEEEKVDELRERQDILQKKAKKEKQALDELAKKQKEIEKKLADKKGDPEKLKAEQKEVEKQIAERKRELERLAEEQRKLQEDVKEKARELARLQAEGASKELNRAAQEMDRAAQQLENGENPEDAQNEALERLENAQAKLQEAQDELVREQLAKIADKLKGLKERQDAAIAESVRLHKEAVEKKKHWTDPLLQSLKMQAKAQKTIGQETDSLKDKLKGAKVFEHILKRTVKAMDDASVSLDKRFEKGSLRLEAFEKEELADELKSQEETLRLQKEAGRKLTSLLDALKEEIAKAKRPRKQKKDDGGKEPEDGGGLRGPGDGIPPVAQLKALRDEQREINERTKDFAKSYPNWPKLEEAQMPRMAEIQNELAAIQSEQAAIQRLFEEITAAAGKKGENP